MGAGRGEGGEEEEEEGGEEGWGENDRYHGGSNLFRLVITSETENGCSSMRRGEGA